MPRYPVRQADVLALAEAMIGGFINNPSLFPNADVAGLQSARDAYNSADTAQTEAVAQAQLATAAKQSNFARLQAVIKRQLKQSQIDTADNPENLNYIGWGPRADERTLEVPGQPMELKSIEEGAGILKIGWRKPVRSSGGRVQAYIIEKRELLSDGLTGKWNNAGSSLETKAVLKDQKRGIQLEYRVIAINKAGRSQWSNTIAVVL